MHHENLREEGVIRVATAIAIRMNISLNLKTMK